MSHRKSSSSYRKTRQVQELYVLTENKSRLIPQIIINVNTVRMHKD